MKNFILFFLKPLSFLPALIMMYAIYSFSAQTGDTSGNLSYEISHQLVSIGNQVLDRGYEDWEIEEVAGNIEYYVRKAAHMTEYFLLAIAVSFPLYVYGIRGVWLVLLAGFICVGFACGDEYHQSFVEGRGPSVRDVCIDSVGVFFGITVVRIVCWTLLAPARMLARHNERIQKRNLREERIRQRRLATPEGTSGRRSRSSRKHSTLESEGKRHIY
ncbi:MAG: VanZ family protein [Hespellia sp.]|nr:VanZ family protein [Hespellia sp.]